MAKYSFSVEVDSGLKPAGENDFPLARAKDIVVDDNDKRLSEKLPELELPKVTTADNGKVLSVSGGAWAAAVPPSGLPKVTTSDNGKYLGVSNGNWKVMGQMEPDPDTLLPYVKQEDNGKVLSVVNGRWAAADIESGDVPFFDLAAMGLPNVPRNSAVALTMDMAEMMAAHEKGLARLAINIEGGNRYEFVAQALTEGLKYFYAIYGTGRIQVVLTDVGIMVGVFDTLPIVNRDDNGKVLTVTDGRWTAAEAAGGGMTIPEYDLSAMGLPNIEIGNMNGVFAEADTTQLMQDLAGGVVTFKMNFNFDGQTLGAVKTCGGIVVNDFGIATVTGIDQIGDIAVYSVLIMQDGAIGAMAYLLDNMITSLIDAYMEDALGGDY